CLPTFNRKRGAVFVRFDADPEVEILGVGGGKDSARERDAQFDRRACDSSKLWQCQGGAELRTSLLLQAKQWRIRLDQAAIAINASFDGSEIGRGTSHCHSPGRSAHYDTGA